MTIEDTRRLGIEFERRVQTMIPDAEFLDKLDTETIYSFLNLYQDRYVHEIYRNLDQILAGSHLSAHIESVLQSLMDTKTLNILMPTNIYVPVIANGTLAGYKPLDHLFLEFGGIIPADSTITFVDDPWEEVPGQQPPVERIMWNVSEEKFVFYTSYDRTHCYSSHEDASIATELGILNNLASNDKTFLLLKSGENPEVYKFTGSTYEVVTSDVIEDGKYFVEGLTPEVMATGRSIKFNLPETFYMYIRSVSKVTKTFSFKSDGNEIQNPIRVIPNQLVSQSDVWRLIETPHDSLRILRYPAAVLDKYAGDNPTLTVIYDLYTDPVAVNVTFYKQPRHFSLMTSTPCELPLDAFEELVSGAVDLYVQYVAGAEARKRQMDEARRQAAKEQEANNARRGRNSE